MTRMSPPPGRRPKVCLHFATFIAIALLTVPVAAQSAIPPLTLDLGGGCGIPSTPILTSTPPAIGSTVRLTVTSEHPFAPVYLLASVGMVTPLPIPGTSCVVHVELFSSNSFTFSGMTDSTGTWFLDIPLPNDPAVLGAFVSLQARTWAAPGPLGGGDHISGGLLLRIGEASSRIGDTVFCDTDGDGIQGPNEPGLPNVTMNLSCANGFSATTTTDGNGNYIFDNVPADSCTVTFDPTSIPSDKVKGICPESFTFAVQPGTDYLNADFCFETCAPCDGKVTRLELKYLGSDPSANVTVIQDDGNVTLFSGLVAPGGSFNFSGARSDGTMGNKVFVSVNGGVSTEIHTSCSQPIGPGISFGDFEVVGGASLNGGALCPLSPCERGKPCNLVVRYTGEGCSATSHSQDPSKVSCSGNPAFAMNVHIRATEEEDPNDTGGKIWFEGPVMLGATFDIAAAAAGESRLQSKTFVHIFASATGSLLQTIEFHTSCSQPLFVGNQFGSIRIEEFYAEGECSNLPGGSGTNLCGSGIKPARLMMQYTGSDCSATITAQDPSKVACSGDPVMAQTVTILSTDDDDPSANNAKVWFSGSVALGGFFEIDAANGGETRLENATFIHIFSAQGTLLQSVEFHTSCSQPLRVGDQFGASLLTAFIAEN